MSIELRKANKNDCKLIYLWANDEEVRKNSFNTKEISYEEHLEWYNKKLKDPNCNIYILANSYKSIGIIRIERKCDENIISYSISKDNRGKGYGYRILLEIEEELIKSHINIKLNAYVKKQNIPSIKIFNDLNYKMVEEQYDKIKFEKIVYRRDSSE